MKNSKTFLGIGFGICIALAVALYFAGCSEKKKEFPWWLYTGTGTGTGTGTDTGTGTGTSAAPAADFTADPIAGPPPLAVNFTDTSTGDVTSWDWDFGDGQTSTVQSPPHTYNNTGAYTVTLTVTGPGGSDTETKSAYIIAGTVYYVDATGGNDTNPGTLAEPWETTGKADQQLQAGDTVIIREGAYHQTIMPSSSGAAGNYITYRAFAGEQVVFSDTTGYDSHGVYLDNKSYIIIDGITIDGWVDGYPDNRPSIKKWVAIEGGGHNIVQNCKMQYSGTGWEGFRINSSSYNKVLNNVMHHCGTHEMTPWVGVSPDPSGNADYGDTLNLKGSHYNLIEGNEISYGGHCALGLEFGVTYNIVRNNIIHNPWEKVVGILWVDPMECVYNLFENNIIAFAYNTNDAGTVANPGWQLNGKYAIVRNNLIHSNSAAGIWIDNWSTCPYSEGHRIYNNVLYHNGHHNMSLPHEPGLCFYQWGGAPIVNNVVINNIFFDNYYTGVRYDGADPAEQVLENNHEGDPLFVDAGNYDFHLEAGSPCIDAGRYLTKTVGSGSGTQFTVEDAGYFCDGFGIVDGDLIQLEGQTQTARITNVDYNSNIITVDTLLSWSSDQGVSLPYSGSAPDIGAYERR